MITTARDVCMLGVGGMGMAPLAIYLAQAGWMVKGYDDHLSPVVRQLLLQAGVDLSQPMPDKADAAWYVRSSAVTADHPQLKRLVENGGVTHRRGEALAEIARHNRLVAVVGSHGKTTTTALLVSALEKTGVPLGYLVGGLFRDDTVSPARYAGDDSWLVAEIDESDGTIDCFSPEITIAVNLDWDHPDHYPTPESLEETFGRLFSRTRSLVVIPADSTALRCIAERYAACPVRTFGEAGDYCGRLDQERGAGRLVKLEGAWGQRQVALAYPGAFNVKNALAALAGCHAVTGQIPQYPWDGYSGIRRRQDVLWQANGSVVLADYAHHPTEIHALFDYLRTRYNKPVHVIFQPHRYTRTRQYAADFARVLAEADQVTLLPVYAASEKALPDGGTESILKAWPSGKASPVIEDPEALPLTLADQIASTAKVVVFVGAGDIDGVAHQLVEQLSKDKSKLLFNPAHPETVWREDEPLAAKTTMRTGGAARYYAEPANEEDLINLLTIARESRIPHFVMGRGSNLIVPDDGFSGVVIRLQHSFWQRMERLDERRIRAGAGVRLKELCGFAAKTGMAGFEFLEGIPATLGGALRMNAGAMGGWMFDVVESVRYCDANGHRHEAPKESFTIVYRACRELSQGLALSAVLVAPEGGATDNIRERMDAMACQRKASQPRDPSAGCIFKNPEGAKAGQLIDQAGLKGLQCGGAVVSPVHANFIVNSGGATTSDIIRLVRRVRYRVLEDAGVVLEPEVMLLGCEWEDVL